MLHDECNRINEVKYLRNDKFQDKYTLVLFYSVLTIILKSHIKNKSGYLKRLREPSYLLYTTTCKKTAITISLIALNPTTSTWNIFAYCSKWRRYFRWTQFVIHTVQNNSFFLFPCVHKRTKIFSIGYRNMDEVLGLSFCHHLHAVGNNNRRAFAAFTVRGCFFGKVILERPRTKVYYTWWGHVNGRRIFDSFHAWRTASRRKCTIACDYRQIRS